MKIEYINKDEKNGILYDFNLIRKEYKKLKCPQDVYNSTHLPLELCKWFFIMSERSRGKTTNLLLLGMIFNKLYGTEIQYLRTREEMITPKNSKDMFTTIVDFGYVEKLTNGKYNNILYKSRRWYYANIDDNGEVLEKAERQFCTMLSIDKAETYKSAYNAPKGDFIIFDEFIERFYYPQQFLQLMDLIKTICRDRFSPLIFLLSNTIDRNSLYFNEFQIADYLDDLQQGEYKIITTEKGTKLYVEILGNRPQKANKKQQELNTLYYGFNNNQLSAITGVDTWSVASYPHTPKDFKILSKNHYIFFNNKYINLEVCQADNNTFINCHNATKIYDDSIIYSLDFSLDSRYRYKQGFSKIDKWIFNHYDKNLFTYSDNTVGALVEKYLNLCK